MPGLVAADGVVRVAPNLGWQDVDAGGAAARPRSDLPVTVDNEANLAALSELRASAAAGTPSFVYVSGEIGIGAGIVLGGELYRGVRGWSGEIGHLPVHPDGPAVPLRRARLPGAVRRPGGDPARRRGRHAGNARLTGRRTADLAAAGCERARHRAWPG